MTESLFTTQTPTGTDNSDGAPGITTATTVTFAINGYITHVRFYATLTVGGTYTGAVWRVTSGDASPAGTLLASKTLAGSPTTGTWNTIQLDTPVAVTAGVPYRIGLFSGAGRYVNTVNFFSSGLTNGNIIAPGDGNNPGVGAIGQGVFVINAALTYPSTAFNSNAYFVDVVFTTTVTFDGTATLAATEALSASGLVSYSGAAPSLAGVMALSATGTAEGGVMSEAASWETIYKAINLARSEHEKAERRRQDPIDCPIHLWPLETVNGVYHCVYGGHVVEPG